MSDQPTTSFSSQILNLLKYCWVLTLTPLITNCGSDEDPVVDPATLTISVSSSTVGEDQGPVPVTFSLSRAIDEDLTLSIAFGGSAARETDYMFPPTVTINGGSTSTNVNVGITDDGEVEDTETVEISISAAGLPEDVTLGSASSITISIEDNDTTDGGGDDCTNDNSTDTDNFECTTTPPVASSYSESVSGDVRSITANGVPNHDYRIQIPQIVSTINSDTRNYEVDATPAAASSSTSITDNNGRPQWAFGVALNGVKIDPAPAEPFIFENTSTGEYNWDWVFEPNTNQEAVGLDCAVAHFQPDGQYHYHGDMTEYADQLLDGLGAGTTTPTEAVQMGWAADGFPILYKFGPNAEGTIIELMPSYRVREGQRSGDGVSEPCGEYNGKYTNDYEYVEDLGDLDACNGVERQVTLNGETFNYFYVITSDFPVISRCFTGDPSTSFRLGGG